MQKRFNPHPMPSPQAPQALPTRWPSRFGRPEALSTWAAVGHDSPITQSPQRQRLAACGSLGDLFYTMLQTL